MKRKIGIDLDSTLNCLNARWLADYNHDYDDNLTNEDMTDWDWTKYVKPECGRKIYEYLALPGYFYSLDIQEHSQEVTKWLSDTGSCELYIATAYGAPAWILSDKFRWISENYPHIPEKNIIFINNKGLLELDYLVDDGPHNVEVFKGQGVLMDYAYNRHLGNKYPRMYSWLDVRKYFEGEMQRWI